MIISKTPLRVSFVGGGTDYPQYYMKHDGAVLGTTINHYIYVSLHNGSISHFFDLPNKSGLGSSSAYTVGLLRVCTGFDKLTIAKVATTWEQDKMGGNVGSQDQYLCALGGFHLLRFDAQEIRDTVLSPELVNPLQDYLMLFNTHQYRQASSVVAHQLEKIDQNQNLLSCIMKMVDEGLSILKGTDYISFGKLLNEAWLAKRQLADDVSTPTIDAIHETGIKAGAIGGKLLGGGGGGFILFFVEPGKQESVRNALSELTYVPFRFETEGTQIIYKEV